jgi:ketosteroid isomerase-like protein
MRFEIRETVQTPDPEIVLRALEMCSREVSSDVVRYGDRITLRGLGPSPRSKNKHDTTVFHVNTENNETVIQGEVNFQASALLGETSQQDVVRSKLDDLFEEMKAQIHLDSLRVAAYAAARKAASTSTAVADRPEEVSAIKHSEFELPEEKTSSAVTPETLTPETLMEAAVALPDSDWGATAIVEEPQEVAAPDQDIKSRYASVHKEELATAELPPAALNGEPEELHVNEESVESERIASTEHAAATAQIDQLRLPVEPELPDEPIWDARTPPYRLRIDETDRLSGWKRFALWVTALAFLLAVAGGGYFLYRSHQNTVVPPAPIAASAVPIATSPPPEVHQRAVKGASSVKTTPPAPPPPTPDRIADPATSSADLKLWLQSWGASMRTKDANAQASFYANTMDRYLEQRNVGREAVLRDREATIHMRKGLWTVKMEDLVIEHQTGSEAEVRLVKHFIDEPEQSEILESFVPTRLTLKRIDGQWQITSEQDLPSLSVTPWKNKR